MYMLIVYIPIHGEMESEMGSGLIFHCICFSALNFFKSCTVFVL